MVFHDYVDYVSLLEAGKADLMTLRMSQYGGEIGWTETGQLAACQACILLKCV